jgi:hypothetical protein
MRLTWLLIPLLAPGALAIVFSKSGMSLQLDDGDLVQCSKVTWHITGAQPLRMVVLPSGSIPPDQILSPTWEVISAIRPRLKIARALPSGEYKTTVDIPVRSIGTSSVRRIHPCRRPAPRPNSSCLTSTALPQTWVSPM